MVVSRLRMDGSMGWMLLCIAEDLGIKNNEKEQGEQAIKKERWILCATSSFQEEEKSILTHTSLNGSLQPFSSCPR
jgi:hypothetical protein